MNVIIFLLFHFTSTSPHLRRALSNCLAYITAERTVLSEQSLKNDTRKWVLHFLNGTNGPSPKCEQLIYLQGYLKSKWKCKFHTVSRITTYSKCLSHQIIFPFHFHCAIGYTRLLRDTFWFIITVFFCSIFWETFLAKKKMTWRPLVNKSCLTVILSWWQPLSDTGNA